MPDQTNKITIPIAVVISLITALVGWNLYRVEKLEERNIETRQIVTDNQEKITQVFGEINTRLGGIELNLSWMEKAINQYKKMNNGVLNVSDFFQALQSGKLKLEM